MTKEYDWIFGAAALIAGLGGFGLQVVWFLRDGTWTGLSVVDVSKWFWTLEENPWLYNPQSWFGAHKILEWLSTPGLVAVWGAWILWGSEQS